MKLKVMLNIVIILLSIIVIGAFFMPWVTGSGSLTKPIDDATRIFKKLDITKVTTGVVNFGRKAVDTVTGAISPIELKKILKGYQIPISDNAGIGRIGFKVYFLYVFPISAFFCIVLCTLSYKKKVYDLIAFFITLVVFIALYMQVAAFNHQGVFIEVRACDGFWLTLFGLLTIVILTFMKLLIPVKKING